MKRVVLLIGLLAGAQVFTASAQHAGHGGHPVLPSQKYQLQVRLDAVSGGGPVSLEVPLDLPNPSLSAELNQKIPLPDPFAEVRLGAYIPSAVLTQQVEPYSGPDGAAAIELAVEGPTQKYRRWLIAGDHRRNQLRSLIGTWRYVSVANDAERNSLFEQFQTERTRKPKLSLRSKGAASFVDLVVKPGERIRFADGSGGASIKEFYPHFAISDRKGEPENRSDRRLNPAVLVEIRYGERTENRWVFAKFPDYQSDDNARLPVEVILDCPVDHQRDVPDFVVVSVGKTKHEVFTRVGDRPIARPIALDQTVPIDGTQYAFRMARFVPSGRLVESYKEVSGKGGVPALRVETDGATTWLEMGKRRVLSTSAGSITLAFGPVVAAPPSGAHK